MSDLRYVVIDTCSQVRELGALAFFGVAFEPDWHPSGDSLILVRGHKTPDAVYCIPVGLLSTMITELPDEVAERVAVELRAQQIRDSIVARNRELPQ